MAHHASAQGGTLAHRSGASRKLLARKAADHAADAAAQSAALEDSFPVETVPPETPPTPAIAGELTEATDPTDEAPALEGEPSTAPSQPPAAAPASAPAWSEADESAFQAMHARRRAAGYQRRGRDVSGELLRVGAIAPNPNTVVAVIVGLVAERGTVTRGDLVAAMAAATFPHPKARPGDRAWCAGYVAGAKRDGFLAAAASAAADVTLEVEQ